MIIARAPVRISLGGGGTDLPAYANTHGGYCITAALDKYVYVVLNPRFDRTTVRVAYAHTEICRVDELKHALYRECLRKVGITGGVELCSMSDVPANTGLGSSSSFVVACLAALRAADEPAHGDQLRHRLPHVWASMLAHEACEVEIFRLGQPMGRQDQYAAAMGGFCEMEFPAGLPARVRQLPVRTSCQLALERRLLIFFTGIERAANDVLAQQRDAIHSGAALERMHSIKAMGQQTRGILLEGDLDQYGELLHQHWTAKRQLTGSMSSPEIDGHYEAARAAGAIGGKLMGAGGGGFLLFYARPEDRTAVEAALRARGLQQLHFSLGAPGVRVTNLP